jgi:hypothetical protein
MMRLCIDKKVKVALCLINYAPYHEIMEEWRNSITIPRHSTWWVGAVNVTPQLLRH